MDGFERGEKQVEDPSRSRVLWGVIRKRRGATIPSVPKM